MKFPTSILPVLMSTALLMGQVSALNFKSLDTPLLEAVARVFCDDDSERATCKMLLAAERAETVPVETEEEKKRPVITVGSFFFKVGCDVSLVPNSLCSFFGEGDSAIQQATTEETVNQEVLDEIGAMDEESDRKMVDGFLLKLLCGENGYAPAAVCKAIVGGDGDSGLMRTFCESEVVIPGVVCDRVGVPHDNPDGVRLRGLRE